MTIKTWKERLKPEFHSTSAVAVGYMQAEIDDLRAELEKIKDNETELPEPFFGMGRYLCIAGTRDAYTEKQLLDYGDKRAMEACAALAALSKRPGK